jgi:predicted permease
MTGAWLRRIAASFGLGLGLRLPDGRPAGTDDEVKLHLTMLAERYQREGLSPAEAFDAARRQFGNLTLQQEERRSLQTSAAIEWAWRLLRDACRQLRFSPLFTATAVLSLALGIGVSTAMFTLLDQLVLRLLPVAEPERLVMLWSTGPNLGDTRNARASSFPLCQDYQRLAVAFDGIFCSALVEAGLTIDRATEPVIAELVTGSYFQTLRVGAAHGRVLSTELDDRVNRGHPVVVLSHRYWVNRLGADPAIVGKKVLVNQHPMDVVGVAQAGFTGIDSANAPQIWLSVRMKAMLGPEDGLDDRHYDFLQMFGRLKAGHTEETARASLQPLFTRMLEAELADPQIARASAFDRDQFVKRRVLVERAAAGYSGMRERYATPLTVLMGMAGLMLLIACSNVASLLVARALARQKDMALRLAIGAGRVALVGQLLVESLLLSLAGAALGFILSTVVTRALLAMMPSTTGLQLLRAEPDLRILVFGVAVSAATAVIFGLVPALQTTKIDLLAVLRASTGGVVSGGGRSTRLRRVLVATQIALSFLLLVEAGLFARTLVNLRQIDTGLRDVDRLVAFQLDPAQSGYTVQQITRFYADLLADIEASPGVTAAAYTWVPLLQGFAPSWNMRVEGYAARNGEDMEVANNIVSPGYWRTMGIPLVEGRDFDDRDRYSPTDVRRGPSVAIVNRSFARRFFGGQSPIGRRFGVGENKAKLGIQIIGVVPDALMAGPRIGPQPQVFFTFLQANFPVQATFYVRSPQPPEELGPALRRLVAARDPALPVEDLKTLSRQLDETLSAERLIAWLSVVFAALATVMAALGLYGVMAFSVARRTRELGLRVALGASSVSIVWLVMREALTLLGAGIIIGLPCALLLGAYVASQLFGVTPTDVSAVAAATATLMLVALAATLVPAVRAGRLDPLRALRQD